MSKPAELLQGTLDLLVLRTLELAPLHGVGISDRIEQVTRGVFVVGPGSLFSGAASARGERVDRGRMERTGEQAPSQSLQINVVWPRSIIEREG